MEGEGRRRLGGEAPCQRVQAALRSGAEAVAVQWSHATSVTLLPVSREVKYAQEMPLLWWEAELSLVVPQKAALILPSEKATVRRVNVLLAVDRALAAPQIPQAVVRARRRRGGAGRRPSPDPHGAARRSQSLPSRPAARLCQLPWAAHWAGRGPCLACPCLSLFLFPSLCLGRGFWRSNRHCLTAQAGVVLPHLAEEGLLPFPAFRARCSDRLAGNLKQTNGRGALTCTIA